MHDTLVTYEAGFDREYETLTEKHASIKKELESIVSSWLPGKPVKPATIQGPYGSGKTQLLYHLFKHAWDKGCTAIYTHLEKIMPPEPLVGASAYADYLRDAVNTEAALLRQGKSNLMGGELKVYARDRAKRTVDVSPIVLLVDELEQKYKTLSKIVQTDDNSPMREVIARVNNGDAGFLLILAFAPVSFYEFSKGEAQTGRFFPIILPVVEPKTFRAAFGNLGNLVWWMGKGRYRGVSRTRDIFAANLGDLGTMSRKDLVNVCRNAGTIGGVPALDTDVLEKVDDFEAFKPFLSSMGPSEQGGELYAGNVKVVKRCRSLVAHKDEINRILDSALKECRVSRVTDIAYYSAVILDGLTTAEGHVPIFTEADDWKEILSAVEDIILEFEGEENLPVQELRLLLDEPSDFSYSVRRNAENVAAPTEAYCIAPGFLRSLFPFPISSPNLSERKIEEQREALADQTYLGREERDGISLMFFLNQEKVGEYLRRETKNFLKEPKTLVAVYLGQEQHIDMPKLARWLQKEGRLRVVSPPRILSSFLVSFFFWLRTARGENLPLIGISQRLVECQGETDKDKARKIAYYTSRLSEYFDSIVPIVPRSKYVLKEKAGFGDFRVGRIGFASEVIGFSFVDNKNDLEVMHKFRKEFFAAKAAHKEATSKQVGTPTALPAMVVEKDKKVMKGAVLRRVSDSFHGFIADLSDIATELSMDEFVSIPADDEVGLIFEGMYLYLREWSDASKAEEVFRLARKQWKELTDQMAGLSLRMAQFEALTGNRIRLTHRFVGDKPNLERIGDILSDSQTRISPFTKHLLPEFDDSIVRVVEPRLHDIAKAFDEFKNSVEPSIDEYLAELSEIDNFEKDTFFWIGAKKSTLVEQFQEEFAEACRALTKGEKVDLESPPNADEFNECIEQIVEELHALSEINGHLRQLKTTAKAMNKMLREWGRE